jgi:hypothetical protein
MIFVVTNVERLLRQKALHVVMYSIFSFNIFLSAPYYKDCIFGLFVPWCTCSVRRISGCLKRQTVQDDLCWKVRVYGLTLEGLCLWALHTLMHMQSEKRRVAKPVIFWNDLCWKGCVFGLCVPWCTIAHAEREGKGGDDMYIQQNRLFLCMLCILAGQCLWALCTLRHMQSEKGKVATK